jgi:hypothetical protein
MDISFFHPMDIVGLRNEAARRQTKNSVHNSPDNHFLIAGLIRCFRLLAAKNLFD